MERGIPWPDSRTALALLPNSVVGLWLAQNAQAVSGQLLDLGAGNQPFRPWYEPNVDSVIAVDAAPAPGIDAVVFAARMPFPDQCFDSVICTSVLEHIDNAETAISEVARVLRPGGRLLITVPFLYPTHEAPYDFWRTTHYGLRSILERHGLEVEDLAAQGGPFMLVAHYVIGGIAQLLRHLAVRLGRFGWVIDNKVIHKILVQPQVSLRSRLNHSLTPLSRVASLGYMAVARKL